MSTRQHDPTPAVELDPDEAVLWSGRPHHRHFRSEAWAGFVLGLLLLTAAAVGWLIAFCAARHLFLGGRSVKLADMPVAVIPAVVFTVFGWRSVRTPWTYRRRLSRALYVVTDRRVVVRSSPGSEWGAMHCPPPRERYEFTPQVVRGRQVKRRHGDRVDLVLGTERVGRAVIEIGILGADDWQAAEEAMRTMSARPPEVSA